MTISGRLYETLSCMSEPEEQRSPLGLTRSGRPVWPIYGSMPDDDADEDEDESDEDEDDSEDDESGTGADKSKAKSKGKKDEDEDDDADLKERLEDAEARADRYKKRMQAADRKNTDLTARVAALEKGGDKDKGENSPDVVALTDERDSLKTANHALRVQNSFLLNNTFTWHDPEVVLDLVLKDEDVEVDEDGKVQGMQAAIKRLARKKPWLVKKAESATRDDEPDDDDDDEDDEDEDVQSTSRRRPSGGAQNGTKSKRVIQDRKLLQTYPALTRR